VIRSASSLAMAATCLRDLAAEQPAQVPGTEAWETSNLHDVAAALVRHATLREETRGGHWREDFPDRDDPRWRGHLVSTLAEDGTVQTRFEELR
jgi:L-aspartate oxidase